VLWMRGVVGVLTLHGHFPSAWVFGPHMSPVELFSGVLVFFSKARKLIQLTPILTKTTPLSPGGADAWARPPLPELNPMKHIIGELRHISYDKKDA
jgi:hypothetical protein